MSKSIKSVAIGLTTALVSPISSLASSNIVSNDNTVTESSKLSRAVSSLDKSGTVTGVASNDTLNVRSSASTNASAIGKLPNNSSVVITGVDGEWYRIDYKGKTGYVYNKYIKINGDITYKKTTDNLNMRTGASTSHKVITKIPVGTTVKVISTSNGWDKVYYGGEFGYCSNSYLTSTTSTVNANPSMNKEGKVTGVASNDVLNVRSQASATSSIVTTLTNGTKVQVVEQDAKTGWYKIVHNGKTGYASNKYITITGDWNGSSSTTTTTTMYTTTNLNIRKGPGTSYDIVSTIPTGKSVECYSEESNGWIKVKYGSTTGYVNKGYLTTKPANTTTTTTKKITTDNVNLRTGPSTSYSIIKTVASNTVVEVISTSGGWSKVKVGSDTGYMSSNYLKDYNGSSSNNNNNSGLVSSKTAYSKIKVVVDAGHGGTDPGAVAGGAQEKDIVLSVSNKVNSKLKSLGFQTIMTRNNDTYITLSKRYSIANSNNADLFVSIHANSASSTSAYGIETLYKGAKTLAQNIQTSLINQTGAHSRGVKQRTDLAVLNGTKMPSALVEVGFISNASERSKITNNSYQNKLAVGIVNGIAKYADNNLVK